MIDNGKLAAKFTAIYNGAPPRLFRAPGRVNLIGEHTDYNGGFVLPMAIERETAVAAAPRNDRKIRVYTVNLEESAEFDLESEVNRRKGFWLNYIEGVARLLEQNNVRLNGANLVIWSDVPPGAGLSSSAALETAVGLALSEISNQPVDKITLAKIGQQAEHEYVGANVGIMDQFVSANALAGHALLLDCRSLEYENVPLATKDVAVVICDTKVKHELANSEYNMRRAECGQAVEILKQYLPAIEQLRDVGESDLEEFGRHLPEVIFRRARHVITENARTLKAAAALRKTDLTEFGRLMQQSHESLKNDYEVSCRELDLMAAIAANLEGVLGSRMTGGGFGGSTVNLVKREFVAGFETTIRREYRRLTQIEPLILISEASAGASEIRAEE